MRHTIQAAGRTVASGCLLGTLLILSTPVHARVIFTPERDKSHHAPAHEPLGHDHGNGDSEDIETPTRPVPEPGTIALLSMGLIAFAAVGRKAFLRNV